MDGHSRVGEARWAAQVRWWTACRELLARGHRGTQADAPVHPSLVRQKVTLGRMGAQLHRQAIWGILKCFWIPGQYL